MTPLKWHHNIKKANLPAKAYLQMLRTAFAANPDRDDLLRDLVVSLRDGNYSDEVIKILLPRYRNHELNPQLIFELGLAAVVCQNFTLALDAFEQTTITGVRGSNQKVALVLGSLGRNAEAEAFGRKALAENPFDERALEIVATALLKREAFHDLHILCDQITQQGVRSTTLLAYQAACMAVSGRTKELDTFLDPQRWCSQTTIDPDRIDNDCLADAILNHPNLAPSSEYKATQGANMRLTALANQSEPVIQHLLSIVRDEINAYVEARMNVDSHPLMINRPTDVTMQGWALVMSEDGHERPHIHPKSWLTSVYYVRTPEIRDGESPRPGSLVFGAWPAELAGKTQTFPSWHVTPQAGTLLIFPAFMAHHTVPTYKKDLRISVALDVMALG